MTNFLVAAPLKADKSQHVCEAIIRWYLPYFGTPTHIICDRDPAFLSSLNEYLYQQTGITIITISPTNHKSLQAEHGIKSLSTILMKHLTGIGKNWDKYLGFAMLTNNAYITPNLGGLSPHELVFGHKAKLIPQLEIQPEVEVAASFKDYQT